MVSKKLYWGTWVWEEKSCGGGPGVGRIRTPDTIVLKYYFKLSKKFIIMVCRAYKE